MRQRQLKMDEIHWVCPNPTPYNNFLFQALARCSDLALTVHFLSSASKGHPWQSPLPKGFRSELCGSILGIDWRLVSNAFRRRNAFFVLGGWNHPTIVSVVQALAWGNGRFAVWTDTPNTKTVRPPLKAWLRNKWIHHVFTRAERVLGTGSPALGALTEMGCPPDKLVDFPYFIDLDLFTPSGHDRTVDGEGEVVFLSSGRLVNKHKGYDSALRALRIVKGKRPALRFRYRLAGTGPDEDALKKLAAELELLPFVEFTGWLEQHRLPDFYRSGHVFLHPAPFEPFGNTVLEAMACGLVVIGSNRTAAVIDRIRHDENGYIHAADDPEDLAKAVLTSLSSAHRFAEIGAAARRAAELWPVERGCRIIREMVAGRPPIS